MSALWNRIPLVNALRGSDRAQVRREVVAGLTVSVLLVPQAVAYAQLAGLQPIVGLYAAIVPVALYALLGTSRQLGVGPVALVSLLVASAIAPYAEAGTAAALGYAMVLGALVGLLQLAMGVARLGVLIRFVSHPVVAGFTAAAALIIAFSQLGGLLGVSLPRTHHIHEVAWQAVRQAGSWHLPTVAVGIGTLLGLLALERIVPRFPRQLGVVAAAAAVVALLLPEAGVAVVGATRLGLPDFALPALSLHTVAELFPMAATIAIISFANSAAIGRTYARRHRMPLDPDQELLALGAANLGGALTGGYPVAGSFSRSAVNDEAGARTGLSGLVTSGTVLVALLFLTPALALVPRAALGAVIVHAVLKLLGWREALALYAISRADFWQMALAFVATLALGIEQGIVVGVLASLAWFVRKVTVPHVAVLGRVPGTRSWRKAERHLDCTTMPGVLAVRIDAPLFYANSLFLRDSLRGLEQECEGPLRAVVLDATGIGALDASAASDLDALLDDYEARGIDLYLAGVHEPVEEVLGRTGFLERLGPEHMALSVHEAMATVELSTPAAPDHTAAA